MIEPQHLRIGNLVNASVFGGKGKSEWVHLLGVIHTIGIDTVKLGDGIVFEHRHLKPIPLTEEILLKVGFEKIPHFTVMNSLTFDLGRDRSLSVGCVGTPNEMLFLREGNGKNTDDLISIHNFDYDGKLYLHKLQNIVSIFGKELNTAGLI